MFIQKAPTLDRELEENLSKLDELRSVLPLYPGHDDLY